MYLSILLSLFVPILSLFDAQISEEQNALATDRTTFADGTSRHQRGKGGRNADLHCPWHTWRTHQSLDILSCLFP